MYLKSVTRTQTHHTGANWGNGLRSLSAAAAAADVFVHGVVRTRDVRACRELFNLNILLAHIIFQYFVYTGVFSNCQIIIPGNARGGCVVCVCGINI